jgi:putative transferase (TIGR04331 family)
LRNHPAQPRAIVSGIGWYFDEPFKQWAAEQAEGGTLLTGMQHGGNYGAFRDMLWHEHEIRITDRFYSWGWTANDDPKVKPLPATKLAGRRTVTTNPAGDILYVTSTFQRFPLLLAASDFHAWSYIDRQLRFLRAMTPRFGRTLRVRPHREDLGWDYVKRWRGEFPDLAVEDWSTPFLQSLDRCRIYVADHLETTYIEALAVNKPTVLLYDPTQYRIREEAKPYYDGLASAGILHMDPESAAATLERVFDHAESWWNEPERQKARALFCERFAWTAPDAAAQWAREFRALA